MNFLTFLIISYAVSSLEGASTTDSQIKTEWSEFKIKFNRTYHQPEEETKRYEIFKENKVKIKAHNEKYESGTESFKVEINRYGDMNWDEIVKMHTPNGTDDE
jgi:hypothetical protein